VLSYVPGFLLGTLAARPGDVAMPAKSFAFVALDLSCSVWVFELGPLKGSTASPGFGIGLISTILGPFPDSRYTNWDTRGANRLGAATLVFAPITSTSSARWPGAAESAAYGPPLSTEALLFQALPPRPGRSRNAGPGRRAKLLFNLLLLLGLNSLLPPFDGQERWY
jgi:hypothetical protein